VNVEGPLTEAKTWIQNCPLCGEPWRCKIWIRRGLPELIVEPAMDLALKSGSAKKKPVAKKATSGKVRKAAKPAKKAAKAAKAKTAPKARKRASTHGKKRR
jgi:hypothetical protein